jgi:hypothetical protein
MWGQLSLEKLQAARGIDFRFLFASGTLTWYSEFAQRRDSRAPASRAGVFICA